MKCRHCQTEFAEEQVEYRIVVGTDSDGEYVVYRYRCPKKTCDKDNLFLYQLSPENGVRLDSGSKIQRVGGTADLIGARGIADEGPILHHQGPTVVAKTPIRPFGASRPPAPIEVTDATIVEDYAEACLVLEASPKASAALSRRCLEQILVAKLNEKEETNLHDKIENVRKGGKLPDYIAEDLHMVREIGNFGAHPRKSTNTGEVLPVEPGEAEWNLDVIEELFEFLYVAPKRKAEARGKLNEKLGEVGKKPV